MADLLEKVARLPDQSLIYYLHIFEDGAGKVYMPAEALELIAARANAPIFSHVDSYLGRGIVGGRVFSFEAAGKQAAGIGVRILTGERPEAIGIQQPGDNVYMFDWRQLKRWGIREANLPPGSIVRYKELTMWDQYKWPFIGAIAVSIFQGLLITGLIVQGYRRQRAERRFRQAVDAAPTGMLIIGQNGEVVLANAQMEKLFGYSANEMVGQPTENFVPARYRSEHLSFLRRFSESPQSRPMGTGQELVGRRKDGSEFPIEVGLNPLRTEQGVAILASVIDVTERREAEQGLRQSQATLRELTGKLLGAQETERRRIARELHDDLGQSLALLSVELDLLQQRPPQDSTQLAARVAKLSSRVKQLSSSIHDLSHQLHPMKLEQLGLIAAIRGLCQELNESHDVVIGFVYDQPPDSVPQEIALCLYRIAQEALQNIIKHSRAQHVAVELRPSGEEVCLRIRDDGIGFDPSSVAMQGGLGLASMRERVRLVNGEITIQGNAPRGTQIEARVPLGIGGTAAVESQDGFAFA
jgi:PAS domain S-box-containing protein